MSNRDVLRSEVLQMTVQESLRNVELDLGALPAEWIPSDLEGVRSPDAGRVVELIPSLLPKANVTTIGAEWKTAKTLLLYRIVVDAVTGHKVLGHLPIPGPLRVLMVQLEMPEPEDERRYRRLAIGAGIDPAEIPDAVSDGRLIHLNRPHMNLSNPAHAMRFVDYVGENGCELVLIDSYTAAFGGAELNRGEVVSELFRMALDPLTSRGVTIAANHHANKASMLAPRGGGPSTAKASLIGSQAFGARSGRVYTLRRADEVEPDTNRLRRFVVRLTDVGGWTPDADPERMIQVYDTPDDAGTVVELLTRDEIEAAGGITKAQRAKYRLAELADRQPGIHQDDAIEQVAGELAAGKSVVKDGLKQAKTARWVVSRKTQTGKPGCQPLALYSGEEWDGEG